MEELTESARQYLVSQGIIVGTLSLLTSIGLLISGTIVLVRAYDILYFTSLNHLAYLEIVCGTFSLLVTAYVCWITVSYRNRQLEIRSKYLDESMSKGLVSIILAFLINFSGFFVSAIFLMIKSETSSTYDLKNAMSFYSMNVETKILIDKLQILFKCCGSQSLLDWFMIDWQNPDSAQGLNKTFTGWDSVPFSCCCTEAPPPCIHHQIQLFGVGSLYNDGCADKLDKAAFVFVLVAMILLLVSTLQLFYIMFSSRKLQTSARAAIEKGDATAPGAWWLLLPHRNLSLVNNDLTPLLDSKKSQDCRKKKSNSMTVALFHKTAKISTNPNQIKKKLRLMDSTAEEECNTSKFQDELYPREGSSDWTRKACEATETSSTTSFITTSLPISSTTESRRSASDTAVANLEVSHHFEHKVRPLYRS